MIGKTLGKYKIIDLLGRGGMAEVYRAYQANLDRNVALKLIKTAIADNPDSLARFEREAKSAAALRHPNIVQIYDFDIEADSGRPYMVMELIEGGSLADDLEKRAASGTPLTLAETARIMSEVSTALGYAHQHGVIHRDVKPSNVMKDTSGRMILTDFGLAKLESGPSVTTSGVSVGTPDYMAPEQVMGEPVDTRADLYALGVILFKLLTGHLPFRAETPTAVMIKHISDPVPDPRTIKPDLPESLVRVVMKSLGKSPDERFQTADEFLAAFRAATAGAEPSREAAKYPTSQAAPAGVASAWVEKQVAPGPIPSVSKTRGSYVVTLEITPPPEPSAPPKVVDFIGREAELADFTGELDTRHLAVITGMPGVGKTALASELAGRREQPATTFWHTFHEGEGVNVLIWKLAGFLAWHDQRDLWNTLQGSTQTGSQAPPPEVLMDYMFQMVRGKGFLLCLDDFHCVDDDPLLGQFVERLQPALAAGELDVIIATQRRPTFVLEGDVRPLEGLALADVRTLLTRRGISLPDQSVADLHDYTGGNAELVMLVMDALRRAKEPARLINRLSESEQVERFLVKEVDEGLTDEERSVMSAVAVLMGYPGTRDAIAAALDGASVRRPLNDLVSRSLLTVVEGESGKEYTLNAMVRAYYYDLLSQRERQAMHQRLGEFYETEAPDALGAALHLQRCGEYARALRLVTADVWAIINQGRARPLRQVLEAFVERQMDKPNWVAVLLARGQVYTLLGETQTARASYEAALEQAKALTDAPGLYARACRGIAELIGDDAPQEALDWLRRGLEAIKDIHSEEEAALHIRSGRLLTFLGNHDAALAALQQGLERLPPGPSRLYITALGNLGNIYCIRGDIERGQAYYQQVLKNAQKISDYWMMVVVWINTGIELDIAGRWAEAIAQYRQASEEAERLGALQQQARAVLGIGNSYIKLGDDDAAQQYLAQCLEIARRKDWKWEWMLADISLAGLHVSRGEAQAADALLDEAEQLAQATGVREPLPELYYDRALARLAQGQPTEALTHAERALTLARELQSVNYEGISLRVLGQAQWANGQLEAAPVSFEQSLRILGERDPYEAARTKLEWARCLKASGDSEQSATLSQVAQSAFRKLGARRDLADLEKSLTERPHLL